MGGDSNPRCLSAHTLSRRAQSTTLSPIQSIGHSNRKDVAGEADKLLVLISVAVGLWGEVTACVNYVSAALPTGKRLQIGAF
jgi:hypothetical protein